MELLLSGTEGGGEGCVYLTPSVLCCLRGALGAVKSFPRQAVHAESQVGAHSIPGSHVRGSAGGKYEKASAAATLG